MGKLKSENRNFTIPGNPMTPKEIDEMILQAETGKFYSMEELKRKVSEWKLKHENFWIIDRLMPYKTLVNVCRVQILPFIVNGVYRLSLSF